MNYSPIGNIDQIYNIRKSNTEKIKSRKFEEKFIKKSPIGCTLVIEDSLVAAHY